MATDEEIGSTNTTGPVGVRGAKTAEKEKIEPPPKVVADPMSTGSVQSNGPRRGGATGTERNNDNEPVATIPPEKSDAGL